MTPFDPANYGPHFAPLWTPTPLPALGPGAPREGLRARLAALSVVDFFAPAKVVDRDAALGCVAGLWLWNDFLDESHAVSQNLDTPSGSFWHGIMHRREPDYGNAKYWFRRVGRHPIYPRLAEGAAEIARGSGPSSGPLAGLASGQPWDAFAFVDLCEEAARTAGLRPVCEQIAALEWQLLFDHDWRSAIGAP